VGGDGAEVGKAGTIGAQHALDVEGGGIVCGAAFAMLRGRNDRGQRGGTLMYNVHAFAFKMCFN
jgi:hypothetical protein